MAMVLLPIGGLSHYAQADMPTVAEANTGGWSWLGVGMVPEPGAMGLIFMGGLWLFLRGYSRYCRGAATRD